MVYFAECILSLVFCVGNVKAHFNIFVCNLLLCFFANRLVKFNKKVIGN
uniref:Uncharacterized protein n=1 Tax=Arundo donax TaxID=35708 RepID=A0A0A9DRK7_ARUDO